MNRRLRTGLAALILLALCVAYLARHPVGQRPDRSFEASVGTPAYTGTHPILLFDQGHNNAQSATGGYSAFAQLMHADGYNVRVHKGKFSPDALSRVAVLVIVNADGGTNPKLLGFNLVPLRKGERGSPAFAEGEVRIVREWVEGGGALLLVADHAPFGTAAAGLAAAFGTTMHGGFTEVAGQYQGQADPSFIEFSTDNGLLADHPIIAGRTAEERVHRVRSFTGQSLDGPPASALLKLPPSAVEPIPVRPEAVGSESAAPPAGAAQAVAVEYGRGRVVILGEAGMITAQLDGRGRPFGMNQSGLDNRQLALNIAHWLTRLL